MLGSWSFIPSQDAVLLDVSDFLPWTCFGEPSYQSTTVGLGVFLVATQQTSS